MRRAGALSLLCAAALGELVLAGLAPAPHAAALYVAWAALRRFVPRFGSRLLAIGQSALGLGSLAALFLGAPLVQALLLAGTGLMLLRALSRANAYNDFLVLLFSIVVAVGCAGVAAGLRPVAIMAFHLACASFGVPVLMRDRGRPAASEARVRATAPPLFARATAAAALLILAFSGIVGGGVLYFGSPRFAPSAPEGPGLGGSVERRRARTGLGAAGRAAESLSGFPESIELDDSGSVRLDPSVALTLDLRLRGRPYDPPAGQGSLLLLRLRVFPRYDAIGRRWERAPGDFFRRVSSGGVLEPGSAPLSYGIRLERFGEEGLFLPQRARRIQGVRAHVTPAGEARREGGREYLVEAAFPPFGSDALRAARPDRSDPALLEVPRQAMRAIAPATPVRPGSDLPDAIEALRAHFAGYRYSAALPEGLRGAPDPLARFFAVREGHCELFASAACLFLRHAGIPARVVGGVRCSERIAEGLFRARYRNAHAWVEVPVETVGFLALDFTPSGEGTAGPTAGGGGEREEAEGAGGREEGPLPWREPFRYGREEQARLLRALRERLPRWPLAIGAAAVVLLGLLRAVARRRRARPPDPLRVAAPEGVAKRTLAPYERWLRACAAAGHARKANETPREFLESLPPPLREGGDPITRAFERQRYG